MDKKAPANACLLCGEELEYLKREEQMQCVYCGRTFMSAARCKNGHYVCDECHGKDGNAAIIGYCLHTDSRNPIEIAETLMRHPAVHMHGPEHHVLVGAALLAAYCNSGGAGDKKDLLERMALRGGQVPGGVCGLWGSCGAGISTGIFISLVTGATPITTENWGLSNQMTSRSLEAIGKIGGPRCCKRDSFLAICEACRFAQEKLGVTMELPERIVCSFIAKNRECLGARCPFSPAYKADDRG